MEERAITNDAFAWSNRFDTGLREIDLQHRKILQLINALAALAIEGTGLADMSKVLDELLEYSSFHFKTEEDLMLQYRLDPDFASAHAQAHSSLTEQIRIVRNLAETTDTHAGVAVGRLLPFLTKWMIFHVLGVDMRMAHEILALQRGDSMEEAHQHALVKQTDSLIIVLDALNELNDNLTRRSTELQETIQRLRISDARYAMASRAAHIGSWELDFNTGLMFWSDEVFQLFDRPQDGVEKTLKETLSCVFAEDRSKVEAAMYASREGDQCLDMECRIIRPDGAVRWIALTASTVPAQHGHASRLVGIMRDIHGERLARQQLKDTNHQLSLSLASLERHATDLTHLNELNEGLQSCLSAVEAFEVVEHSLGRLALGSGGALAVVTATGHDMKTVARWGDSPSYAAHFTDTCCLAMRRGQIHSVRHAATGLLCKHFDQPFGGSYMCLPLRVFGETLGLLSVLAPAEVGEREWSRISHLASMVSESLKLALSNIRLREALHEQATRDPLTRLLNRRYLDETLPREIMRAQRERRSLSLAMLDLDHFKLVNDSWGHEAGDAVLQQLATTIRGHLRASDLACRFGGEEFVIVMLGASMDEARERIEEVAQHVRDTPVKLPDKVLPPVTFSAGLAQAFVHGDTADELLRAADRALYAAKESGRDCILDAITVS